MDYEAFNARRARRFWGLLLLGLAMLVTLVMWGGSRKDGPVEQDTAAIEADESPVIGEPYSPEELAELEKSMASAFATGWVQAKLRDPDTAKFRNFVFTGKVVCGEVNARNGFGGYIGYQRFIAVTETHTVLESEGDGTAFAGTWDKVCAAQ